ncbi:unnamed protein product [Caenorhabditis sp. 36 PRJEB53466]|nr:unnamed protein product [Caenorhabditis sp. 36 PRJEB53466]
MQFPSVFLSVLLIFILPNVSVAQFEQVCKFCSGELSIPSEWSECQDLLRGVCSWLITSPTVCTFIVNAADLSSSYSNARPHLVQLKDIACKKYKNYC